VLDRLKEHDPAASFTAERDIRLPRWGCTVFLVAWRCSDPPAAPLPSLQTLERLVSAALVAAYPNRGVSVSNWLATRGAGAPAPGPKEHAWSHMAGWYAERNCEAFYELLWSDPVVSRGLKERLYAGGAGRAGEALAS